MVDQTYIFPNPLEVTISSAGNFAVAGVLTVVGASTLTGLLTVNGGITLGANQTATIPATGAINMATGAKIKANGTQASAIANAETAHALNATFDDTEVEAALNALGTKINSIIAAIHGVGVTA